MRRKAGAATAAQTARLELGYEGVRLTAKGGQTAVLREVGVQGGRLARRPQQPGQRRDARAPAGGGAHRATRRRVGSWCFSAALGALRIRSPSAPAKIAMHTASTASIQPEPASVPM